MRDPQYRPMCFKSINAMGRMPEASLANMKFRLNTVLSKTLCYKK